MRTINQLPAGTPRDPDTTKFPDSTILNETNTAPGTPVVREIYGDVLTNIYKLLRITGIDPTGTEDSETSQYQLIQALQKLANAQNDIEQVLNLSGTIFSIALDLAILPNKYVCQARAAEAYVNSITYTFMGNGTGGQSYGFTCPEGFVSGDELLLIIDQAGVRAYNISAFTDSMANTVQIFTPFGTPLAYSDNNAKIYYQSEGILFSDQPEAHDLQSSIRALAGDGTMLVYEMFLVGGFILCLSFSQATLTYRFYKFNLSDLSTPIVVTGPAFPSGVDNRPNVYTNGTQLAITNNTGNSANDYLIDLYTININAGTLTASGSISLDPAFQKTTNAVIVNNNLYTFIAGVLLQYSLASGIMTYGAAFPGFIGVLFNIKADVWYSNGEVAKKWVLPVY